MSRPLVLLPSDVRPVGIHPFHCVGEKYINAVLNGADAIPLLMPSWGAGLDLDGGIGPTPIAELLNRVDGVFLTGSPSNVHPRYYDEGGADEPAFMLDGQRDVAVFELIDACLAAQIPLLVVCRGFQELNVALGGSLHQAVHETGEHHDHRENPAEDRDSQYGPAHKVAVQPGGVLADLIGKTQFEVNSLHSQGIKRLAAGLKVEALAPDGLVEAVSMPGRDVLGVQWHPEWRFPERVEYQALFKWFGQAARRFASARRRT